MRFYWQTEVMYSSELKSYAAQHPHYLSNNSNICISSYSQAAKLFIPGGKEISLAEGTTQGHPTVMPIYALESLLLLNIATTDITKRVAYADDVTCVGELKNMLTWWNKLNTFVLKFVYFPKVKKSWLIVKPEKQETAKVIFKDTRLNITNESKDTLNQ